MAHTCILPACKHHRVVLLEIAAKAGRLFTNDFSTITPPTTRYLLDIPGDWKE